MKEADYRRPTSWCRIVKANALNCAEYFKNSLNDGGIKINYNNCW